ncbi:MAG TPA: T9SS type A sorting domain-containing protein [Flavobacteriales bacterium]|nr:T9SS type A sorting domain-containing protein [Flavobacteriales bacterium]
MATASVNLTNVTGGPSVSTFGTDPTSCNTNDGYASANASAGAPPYTYSWSNGGNTAAINGLNAGTFTVTVSDANACITTGSVILNSTGAPAVTAIGTNPTSCSTSDGMATANVSAGTAPYTYSWSNGSSNPAINGLTSGTYTLTVTDANACMTSVIITLSASGAPSLVMTDTDLTCYGDNSGTATSTVSSGLAPYSYLWSNGGTGSMLSGLSGGIYSLTITDANGCLVSGSSSIAEPTEILTSIAATDANCSGASDGAADLSVSGGTPPYGYSWSDGSTTEDLTGIAAGTYTVDVTDNNGCTVADVATINEISSGPQTGIILGATQVSASSQEQYAVSQNIGYTYSWTVSGGIILSGQGSNIIQVQWGNAGSGQVAIVETDSAGCMGDTVTLEVVIGAGTSIIMNPGSSDMIIYPNPFNQTATVVFSNEAHAIYELVLYDMLGKKVRRLENISSNEVLINKGMLSPGMYFLELQGIAKTFRGRIIVE